MITPEEIPPADRLRPTAETHQMNVIILQTSEIILSFQFYFVQNKGPFSCAWTHECRTKPPFKNTAVNQSIYLPINTRRGRLYNVSFHILCSLDDPCDVMCSCSPKLVTVCGLYRPINALTEDVHVCIFISVPNLELQERLYYSWLLPNYTLVQPPHT